MKTFKEYLAESFNDKKYMFKVKIAGDVSKDQEDTMKTALEKYKVENFAKNSTTPIQSLPLDFPKIRNTSVNIYDVTLAYPVTQFELHEYICNNVKLGADTVVVRNPFEPTEDYQANATDDTAKKEALLTDSEYKEGSAVKVDDYFGQKYNENLLKELSKASKERATEQGLKIPSGE